MRAIFTRQDVELPDGPEVLPMPGTPKVTEYLRQDPMNAVVIGPKKYAQFVFRGADDESYFYVGVAGIEDAWNDAEGPYETAEEAIREALEACVDQKYDR
jgi:hypothetical protein